MIPLPANTMLLSWMDFIGPLHGWAIGTAAVVSACCAMVGTLWLSVG